MLKKRGDRTLNGKEVVCDYKSTRIYKLKESWMVENNQKQTEEQWLSMQTGLTSSLAQRQGMERREFTIHVCFWVFSSLLLCT